MIKFAEFYSGSLVAWTIPLLISKENLVFLDTCYIFRLIREWLWSIRPQITNWKKVLELELVWFASIMVTMSLHIQGDNVGQGVSEVGGIRMPSVINRQLINLIGLNMLQRIH